MEPPLLDEADEKFEQSVLEEGEFLIPKEEGQPLEPLDCSLTELEAPASSFLCNYCTARFKEKDMLTRHVEEIHKQFICEECGMRCSRSDSLRSHRALKHENPDVKFTCPYEGCSKVFARKPFFEDHLNYHLKNCPFKCTKCDKVFHNRYKRNQHMKQCGQSTSVQCKLCSSWFSSPTNLCIHKNSVHGDNTYRCEQCGKQFKYVTGLYKHKQQKGHK